MINLVETRLILHIVFDTRSPASLFNQMFCQPSRACEVRGRAEGGEGPGRNPGIEAPERADRAAVDSAPTDRNDEGNVRPTIPQRHAGREWPSSFHGRLYIRARRQARSAHRDDLVKGRPGFLLRK